MFDAVNNKPGRFLRRGFLVKFQTFAVLFGRFPASIIPTFAITIIVTGFFWKYTDNPWVRKSFTGILVGVSALIIYSTTKLWKTAVKDFFDVLLVLISAVALILFKINAVLVIVGVAQRIELGKYDHS